MPDGGLERMQDRLCEVEGLIKRAHRLLEMQLAVVQELRGAGRDTRVAEARLLRLLDTESALQAEKRMILEFLGDA
jgi:hypothetical protein